MATCIACCASRMCRQGGADTLRNPLEGLRPFVYLFLCECSMPPYAPLCAVVEEVAMRGPLKMMLGGGALLIAIGDMAFAGESVAPSVLAFVGILLLLETFSDWRKS